MSKVCSADQGGYVCDTAKQLRAENARWEKVCKDSQDQTIKAIAENARLRAERDSLQKRVAECESVMLHYSMETDHSCMCQFANDTDAPTSECGYHEKIRAERDSWKREAELNQQAADESAMYAERLATTLDLLRKHGIHVDEKWCWCEPKVESYRENEK